MEKINIKKEKGKWRGKNKPFCVSYNKKCRRKTKKEVTRINEWY